MYLIQSFKHQTHNNASSHHNNKNLNKIQTTIRTTNYTYTHLGKETIGNISTITFPSQEDPPLTMKNSGEWRIALEGPH